MERVVAETLRHRCDEGLRNVQSGKAVKDGPRKLWTQSSGECKRKLICESSESIGRLVACLMIGESTFQLS